MLAEYQSDFYRDTPAVTENKFGKGTGYYLACRTDDGFLADFYSNLAHKLDLLPDLPISKTSETVSIQYRENESNRYYFVQNFSDQEQEIKLKKPMQELLTKEREQGSVNIPAFGTKVLKEK